ncbi:hypothetical protein ILUMI_22879 [Ignelater luminosus]|uniref:Uncharacterized protein n=1 Tax=Ignelater luminosus TaxID=2038154 RepID=A0A8K0FX71_IGNLU|nr:hypothetical protein ILUMI_22879 [Ignelater luminosus]
MKFELTVLYMIIALTASATISPNEETEKSESNADNEAEETNIINTITAIKPATDLFANQLPSLDLGSFPYEAASANVYDTFPIPQASYGVAINSQALLGPKVEFLYLIESTINLVGDLLSNLQAKFNDNYELFRAAVNFIISKSSFVKTSLLKVVTVLRKVLQFAYNIFNDFSITLPSITIGAQQGEVHPHIVKLLGES